VKQGRHWTRAERRRQSQLMKGNRLGVGKGRPPVDPVVRFMSKVNKTKTCWLWNASSSWGYGQFSSPQGMVKAHRWSYEYFVGPIPAGKDILHTCDVPRCVNPSHLYPGTDLENQRDKWRRGRGKRMLGATNGMFGKRPWNLGKTWSKEVRAKISKGRKGIAPWNLGIPGRPGWPPKESRAS
jgi:hypothetical protein